MALDYAGATLIGTAATLLFYRIVLACVKAQEVRDALRVHHAKPPPSRLSRLFQRLQQRPFPTISLRSLVDRAPSKLRLAAGLAAVATIPGVVVIGLPMVLPTAVAEHPLCRVLLTLVKWTMLAAGLRWLKANGKELLQGRAATDSGTAKPKGKAKSAAAAALQENADWIDESLGGKKRN